MYEPRVMTGQKAFLQQFYCFWARVFSRGRQNLHLRHITASCLGRGVILHAEIWLDAKRSDVRLNVYNTASSWDMEQRGWEKDVGDGVSKNKKGAPLALGAMQTLSLRQVLVQQHFILGCNRDYRLAWVTAEQRPGVFSQTAKRKKG